MRSLKPKTSTSCDSQVVKKKNFATIMCQEEALRLPANGAGLIEIADEIAAGRVVGEHRSGPLNQRLVAVK